MHVSLLSKGILKKKKLVILNINFIEGFMETVNNFINEYQFEARSPDSPDSPIKEVVKLFVNSSQSPPKKESHE